MKTFLTIAAILTTSAAHAGTVIATSTFARGDGATITISEPVSIPEGGKWMYTCSAKLKQQAHDFSTNADGYQSLVEAYCAELE